MRLGLFVCLFVLVAPYHNTIRTCKSYRAQLVLVCGKACTDTRARHTAAKAAGRARFQLLSPSPHQGMYLLQPLTYQRRERDVACIADTHACVIYMHLKQ